MMAKPRPALATAIVFWILVVAVGLVVRPPLPVDETRYLAVAWEMWTHGDFLVPALNGVAYHHKPPLLFWLMQAGWTVFGVSEIWARLVAPLFALGSIVLTARLARLLWPLHPETEGAAALIVIGSALFALFASLTFFDTLVAFFAVLGWLGLAVAWRAERQARSPLAGWALYAAALGLGVLSKGPVQLLHVLPVALLAPWWMGEQRPIRNAFLRRWYVALGLAVLGGAAIALAWAIPAAIAGGPAFARNIFLGQSTGRIVESFQHARPFWWYVPVAFVIFYPWPWWIALWRQSIAARAVRVEPGVRFCLAIAVPAFIIFSVISGKQPHYLLPLVPAFALIVARLVTAMPLDERRFDRVLVLLPVIAIGVVFIAAPFVSGRILALRPGLTLSDGLLALIAATGVALLGFAAWAMRGGRDLSTQLATLATAPVAILVAIHVGFLALQPAYDVREAATVLHQAEAAGRPIALFGDYAGEFHFSGRLTQPIAEIGDNDAASWTARHPEGVVITYLRAGPPRDGAPLYVGAYRGRILVIWPAREVVERGLAILSDPRQ